MMKKLLCTLFSLLALGAALSAQTTLEQIAPRLADSRVSLDYSFSYGKVRCSGTITIQAPCYKAVGNGVEIWNDGSCRWTVDREAKEVYIETPESPEDYMTYLQGITDLKLTGVKYSPLSEDLTKFIFDVDALSDEWVVTDLRQ